MSDLPPERLTPSPPFTYLGLDVFGPWNVVTRRTRGQPVKTITGCSSKRGAPIEGDVGRANQLNHFFNRFDHPNPFTPLNTAAPTLGALLPQAVTSKKEDTSPPPLTPPTTITAAQVCGELRRLRPSKAAGPDGVSPRLLKACARELGHPLQRIFNLSLGQGRVPQLWKTSCIIPVPKKPHPDYLTGRPQYVRLGDCRSDTVASSTGAPQGVQLDDKLDWTANTDALCRKGQSRLYFLRRLASFNICKKLLQIFYQSVVASALLYAVVCWGQPQEEGRSAPGQTGEEGSLTSVAERRTLNRLLSITDNPSHPLHSAISRQRSSFSDRLLSLSCSTDRLRRSFPPHAIRLYNTSRGSDNTKQAPDSPHTHTTHLGHTHCILLRL
ncbi:hypothetical protein L3Q82_017793, partial [Scortum barcoo]